MKPNRHVALTNHVGFYFLMKKETITSGFLLQQAKECVLSLTKSRVSMSANVWQWGELEMQLV